MLKILNINGTHTEACVRGMTARVSNVAAMFLAGGLLMAAQTSVAQVPASECLKSDGTSGVISSLGTGYSISQPGTYCLTKDLSFNISNVNSSPTAITIAANNVTLDFNGHALNGLYSSGTPGVYNGQLAIYITGGAKNLVIRNGIIAGFYTGIIGVQNGSSYPIANLLLEDMQLLYIANTAVDVTGLNSICNDCTIQNNIIKNLDYNLCTNCPASAVKGIHVGAGVRATVRGNAVSLREPPGLYGSSAIYVGAGNSLIEGNFVESGSASKLDTGILVGGQNSLVANNRITNMKYGVYYSYTTGPYSGNMTVNTTTPYTGGVSQGLNF